ncbi:hypothetical protein BH09MYX1_BH09MYX1_24770 [soil metagenome]
MPRRRSSQLGTPRPTSNGVLAAKNDAWDHAPPKIGDANGDEVKTASNNGASVDTTGALLAASPCP